jgi:hypothetical protein
LDNIKGILYTVKGHKDLDKFAKGILALVNARSSIKNSIVDFKTHEGTNIVEVITVNQGHYQKNTEKTIKALVGEIEEQKEIKIFNFHFDHLNKELQKELYNSEEYDINDEEEVYFGFDLMNLD